jgi:oxygen-dependent protoporphyrinogen oxidase
MGGAPKRVVVVGGGISGLVAAYRLIQTSNGTPIDVVVLEGSRSLGGKLRTGELAGIPIEEGADSFVVRKPWAIDLCRELGLGDDLVAPVPGGAYVWVRGRLVRYPRSAAFGIPGSAEELLRWPGLSRGGRFRALEDLLKRPRRRDEDESIRQLATRRLGPEAADILVGPLLAGINAGDADRLSVAATFPELHAWERTHGSLIRAARATVKASREAADPQPLFATVWAGLSRVIEVLATALGSSRVRLGQPVSSVERAGRGWSVRAEGEPLQADAVILATPGFESARVLAGAEPEGARELAAIRYVSTAVVTLVFPPGTAKLLPPGTGFIVPGAGGEAEASGRRTITACTWVSSKWPREEHAGRAVMRCYAGRDGDQGPLDLDDDELIRRVTADVEAVTPVGHRPAAVRVVRWLRAMPQYELGHLDRLARIEAALPPGTGLFLAGSAYRGVGIADCVRQADEVAERVRAYLAAPGEGGRSKGIEQEAIT